MAALAPLLPHALAAEPPAGDPPAWSLGEGLDALDSFEYRICAGHVVAPLGSECMDLRMEFAGILDGWNGSVWVVQAQFRGHGGPDTAWQDAILRISADGRFSIASDPQHRTVSSLIAGTLFWMDDYAGRGSAQSLEVGEYWGSVMQNRLYVSSIGIEDVAGAASEVATIAYGGAPESSIGILDGFPFPIAAEAYTPLGGAAASQLDYTLQLLGHSKGHAAPPGGTAVSAAAPPAPRPAAPEYGALPGVGDLEWAALIVSEACQAGAQAEPPDPRVREICDGIMPSLPAPPVSARPDPGPARELCTGLLEAPMCYEGAVGRADGITVEVGGSPVRLSMLALPGGQSERDAAASHIGSECPPGTRARVDIDDMQPIDGRGTSMGAVYCRGAAPVNASLLDAGAAPADELQCGISEFAPRQWAERGCGG